MSGLKAAVLMMLDQMMIRVAGESQRVQPQCIDRRPSQPRQPGPRRREMRQIMTQDIVTDEMIGIGHAPFQPIQRLSEVPLA